jgi:hypothetical protein
MIDNREGISQIRFNPGKLFAHPWRLDPEHAPRLLNFGFSPLRMATQLYRVLGHGLRKIIQLVRKVLEASARLAQAGHLDIRQHAQHLRLARNRPLTLPPWSRSAEFRPTIAASLE